MNRRTFIFGFLVLPLAAKKNKKYVFKIKTKSGGIVGNIAIVAKDPEAAKHKLRQRYPDCEILEMAEK